MAFKRALSSSVTIEGEQAQEAFYGATDFAGTKLRVFETLEKKGKPW